LLKTMSAMTTSMAMAQKAWQKLTKSELRYLFLGVRLSVGGSPARRGRTRRGRRRGRRRGEGGGREKEKNRRREK